MERCWITAENHGNGLKKTLLRPQYQAECILRLKSTKNDTFKSCLNEKNIFFCFFFVLRKIVLLCFMFFTNVQPATQNELTFHCQNKNKLLIYRRYILIHGCFQKTECICAATCSDMADTQKRFCSNSFYRVLWCNG